MNVTRSVRYGHWVCQSCSLKALGVRVSVAKRWQSTVPASSAQQRQWSTPLARTIGELIKTTGPISIAAYMRQCLTSPEGGYYTRHRQGSDQFGQKGDFITSPEISQTFGELIGLWLVTEWMAQGRRKSGVELVEVGPGRGTLMDDMLRAIRNFKSFASSIQSVYLVEASPSLREEQQRILCGDAAMEETNIGWKSRSKYGEIPVIWCEDIRLVPNSPDRMPFIVAHEFFDALPIHAFKAVPPAPEQSQDITGRDGKPIEFKSAPLPASRLTQWRELVVSIRGPASESFAAQKGATSEYSADFQLSLARASTPSSLVIPETSDRYKKLKSIPDALIEISPDSHRYAAEFARRIGGSNRNPVASTSPTSTILKPEPSGAALILDYGTLDTVPTSTLRGIRHHKIVSPFHLPGETDLSADVDFTALAEAAVNASPGIEVHGPVEQGVFLESLGIQERAKVLEKRALKAGDIKAEEAAKRIKSAVSRLVERGGGGMGKIYKAMAIVPENGGRRRPVGFGGQVV